jgi:branched-chain amino acid transport system substrate-binding protein
MKVFCALICCLGIVLLTPFSNSAFSKETIEVGVIGPMKYVYGDHMWKGAQLAADEINTAGGVQAGGKTYRIELTKADDNCHANVADAVSAMQRLVTMKDVDYVVGGHRSEAVLAQQEVMADNQILFLGTGSAHDEQSERVAKNYERYKYWFRVGPTRSSEQAKYYHAIAWPVVRAIRSDLGIDTPRVAILADKAKWCDPIVEMAHRVFPAMGCEVVGEWRPSFTASSVAAELSAIKSAGAHLIFQLFAGPAGAAASKQWGELQIPAAIAGVNIEALKESLWEETDGMCNYLATADAMNPGVKISEKTIPFINAFTSRFGERPNNNAQATYDALHVLKNAIERADSLETDAVIKAMEKTDYTGPAGRLVFTSRDHKAPHDVKWGPQYATSLGVQWRNGERIAYWPDGRELHQAILDIGAPPGWDEVRFEGIRDYQLPPRVVEYWKDRKKE